MAIKISNLVNYDEIVSGKNWNLGSNSSTTLDAKLNSDSQRGQLLINFWANLSHPLQISSYTTYRTLFEALTSRYKIEAASGPVYTLKDEWVTGSPSIRLLRPGIQVQYHRDPATNKLGIKFIWVSQDQYYNSGNNVWYMRDITTTYTWEENTALSFDVTKWHNFHLAIDADAVAGSSFIKINGLTASESGFTESVANSYVTSGFSTTQLLTTKQIGAIYGLKWVNPLYRDVIESASIARPWVGWASTHSGLPPVASFVTGSGSSLTYPNYKISLDGTEATTSVRALSWHQQVEPNAYSHTINRGSAGSYWDWRNPQYDTVWTTSDIKLTYNGDEPGNYVLHDVIFSKFVEDDYVAGGYVGDGTVAGVSTLSIATIERMIVGTASLAADATVSASSTTRLSLSASLDSIATLTTLAYRVVPAEVAMSSTAVLSADSMRYAGASATLASTASLVASYAELHPGQASLTTTAQVSAEVSLYVGASANLTAFASTLSVSTGVQYAEAQLSSAFSIAQTPGYLLDVKDDVTSYTWDSLIEWDRFNNERWSINGILLVASGGVVTLGGDKEFATANLTSTFSMTTAGTTVVFADAALTAQATATVSGGIYKDAQANLASESTLSTLGLRIQEIYISAFGNATLTTAAVITASASADITAQAQCVTAAGVKFATAEAILATDFNTSILGSSVFYPTVALSASFAIPYVVITISTYERYRTYTVPKQIRAITVTAEPRTIVVPEQTRYIRVPVPPIIQPTLERQI